jgi:hypothetical protein
MSAGSTRPNQGMMANSNFWRNLADQFLALQDRLRDGGSTAFIYKELKVLAGRGARELPVATSSEIAPDLLAVWLDASKEERLASQFSSQSNEVWTEENYAPKLTKGTLDHLCEASATFCKGLEDNAVQVEFEERFAQSGAKQSPTVTRTPRTRKRSSREERRDAIRFLAIKQGLKGMSYCQFLHEQKIGPPVEWVSDGCPTSYPEAYKKKPWQQKIQDEKYRAGVKLRRMEENEPGELKKLLGIAERATR